nr:FAD-dependent monooxygenase [Mangrovicoccus ximenensis]
MTRETYDAIIVGARCAGAATALQLVRTGARVLLIDSARAGSDTMSTHALMRGAVMLLERWGLGASLRAAGTPQISRTSFIYGTEVFDIDLSPEHGVEALMAPRRILLDRMLAEAAAEAGAELRFETSCVGLIPDAQGRTAGARLSSSDGTVREVSWRPRAAHWPRKPCWWPRPRGSQAMAARRISPPPTAGPSASPPQPGGGAGCVDRWCYMHYIEGMR